MTFERQKPLWWELAKAIIVGIVALAAFGCSQTEVTTSGFKTWNTNFTTVSWSPNSFTAASINTSTPLNSNWRGINKLANTISTSALGLAVPGSTGSAAVTRGAAIVLPHLTTPTAPTETILTR